MSTPFCGLIVMLVLGLCAAGAAAQELVLYVAANGSDGWSGRLAAPDRKRTDGPFATLKRARDEIRALKSAGKIDAAAAVFVRRGTYCLNQPFRLEAADSGRKKAPIVYRSYPGENVRLVGGRVISGFKRYKGKILQCDLNALGLADKPVRQLFFKGKRQALARWPNLDAKDVRGGAWTYVAASVEGGSVKKFKYFGNRPDRWAHPEDCQVSIWPNYNWWHTIGQVAEIDRQNRVITMGKDFPYTIEPGRRYFYQNLFEELDAPGEWFFDKRSGVLYFWPPEPIEKGDVIVPTLDTIVEMQDVERVTFRGFTIECCDGNAIIVNGGAHCLIAGNTIRNTGAWGIAINGGANNGAAGNDIYWTGEGGISLSGGDRATLTPARNYAENNHIHHLSALRRTYNTGVSIGGVGNRVAHNLIHDASHIAIILGGNEHVIEYNEIHHVCMQGGDNGGFYMGRDWTQRGNIIRFNKFHDIYGYGLANTEPNPEGIYHYDSPLWAWGIYLDDCSSGTTVYGNVIYRVPLAGVMIGGGRDNLVENNIFVDCIPALHIDARWDTYPWDYMKDLLEKMNYRQPPYSERYPELLAMGDDPRRPAGNKFLRNVVCYSHDDFAGLGSTNKRPGSAIVYNLAPFDPETTKFERNTIHHFGKPVRMVVNFYKKEGGGIWTWEKWQAAGFDRNSIIANPRFVDPENDDYQLRNDSPAYRQGFKRIPIEKIGLYQDELRASWPVPRDRRKSGTTLTRHTVRIPKS